MDVSHGKSTARVCAPNGAKFENAQKRVADGIPLDTKPLTAAEGMTPTFHRWTARILSREKVIGPLSVVKLLRVFRADSFKRPPKRKLFFVPGAAAIRARNA